MQEEYRILNTIDSKYAVSNLGNIKNIKTEKVLKPEITNKGYKKISLSINGKRKKFYIHRLVALMFLENNNPKKDNVNHKDGNKLNNIVENLEWCTSSENQIHAIEAGLKPQNIPIAAINLSTGEKQEFKSIKDCADKLNMFTNGIRRVLNNECSHHHGYTFIRI